MAKTGTGLVKPRQAGRIAPGPLQGGFAQNQAKRFFSYRYIVFVLSCFNEKQKDRREKSARAGARARSPDQYSSGKRNVVTLRSASVMIQRQLSPWPLQGLSGSIG